MKEYSKTFKTMGEYIGIEAKRKTQRGIIARRYLEATIRLHDEELERFAETMPYIQL